MGNIERRYDIDWLRVLAMLTIFLFHCARFFNYEDWHVKNNQLDFGMSVFVEIVSQWIMPLFFILSAISVYYALDHRNNRLFINERFKRLVIPLVFGIFVLVPPQVYIERVSHSQFAGSFVQFFPHYFDGLYGFGGNFAWMGLHLWYLEILFIFSLLTLPIFRYLRNRDNAKFHLQDGYFFQKAGNHIFACSSHLFHGAVCQSTAGWHWKKRFWRLESIDVSDLLYPGLPDRIKYAIQGEH